MPLNKHVADWTKPFKPNDARVLLLDDSGEKSRIEYPRDILVAMTKYFNDLYQARVVYGDSFTVKRAPSEGDPGLSEMNITVFVPGDLTREDFEDDLFDFESEHPGIKCSLNWRTSPEEAERWNEAHRGEIESGKKKPHSPQGMAKNAKSSVKSWSWPTILKWVLEEEPADPHPEATYEELEELEANGDKELKAYYTALSEYDNHKGAVKPLLVEFKERVGRDFDPSSEDDKGKLEEIYNETYEASLEAEREWYEGMAKITIPVGEFAPGVKGNVSIKQMYGDSKAKKGGAAMPANKPVAKKKATKDEGDQILALAILLGEAHDKVMEALDLAKDLINEGRLADSIEWDLEDLEAEVSEYEFMGEDKPAEALLARYAPEDEE